MDPKNLLGSLKNSQIIKFDDFAQSVKGNQWEAFLAWFDSSSQNYGKMSNLMWDIDIGKRRLGNIFKLRNQLFYHTLPEGNPKKFKVA